MSSEWATVRLEEVTSLLGDGLHGTPVYDQFGEYFFINGSNLKDGRIEINEATKRVSTDEYKKHRKQLNDRTILVSINGTLGNVAIYRGEPIILGKSACYLNVNNETDKDFVRYVLDSQIFQNYISNLATGSTIKNVSLKLMRDFSFNLPPPVTQKSIASILSSIDDRITLLRETNATLEAIAQALFKSWFVDFDPVRAKSEGRLPEGMDEATAALFPDAFEETELGLVPKSWQLKVLGDLIVPKRGKTITKAKCVEGDIPVVAGGLEPAYFHNQSNVSCPVATISASGANAGFVRLYQQDIWASDCSFVSLDQTESIYFWYVFLKANQEKIYFMQQGAAQPHIYPSDLMRLKVYSSDAGEERSIFNSLVSPMFEKIGLATAKIKTLSDLRDSLLPRLISGQLRISDAEAELEKVIA